MRARCAMDVPIVGEVTIVESLLTKESNYEAI